MVADTLTGRIQGVLDVKNALRHLAATRQVQERKRELLAGLCFQLQRIEPKATVQEDWGSWG